jgi:cold shock protein
MANDALWPEGVDRRTEMSLRKHRRLPSCRVTRAGERLAQVSYPAFVTGLPPDRPKNQIRLTILFAWGDTEVAMGSMKWFNPTKGYGFIKPDGSGSDVFVHISAVEKAGCTGLAEGAKISYELVTAQAGKTAAESLRIG